MNYIKLLCYKFSFGIIYSFSTDLVRKTQLSISIVNRMIESRLAAFFTFRIWRRSSDPESMFIACGCKKTNTCNERGLVPALFHCHRR